MGSPDFVCQCERHLERQDHRQLRGDECIFSDRLGDLVKRLDRTECVPAVSYTPDEVVGEYRMIGTTELMENAPVGHNRPFTSVPTVNFTLSAALRHGRFA